MLKVTKFQFPALYHVSTAEGKPSLWAYSTLPVCLGLQLHLWISNSFKLTDSYQYEMQKTLNGPFPYDCK